MNQISSPNIVEFYKGESFIFTAYSLLILLWTFKQGNSTST